MNKTIQSFSIVFGIFYFWFVVISEWQKISKSPFLLGLAVVFAVLQLIYLFQQVVNFFKRNRQI